MFLMASLISQDGGAISMERLPIVRLRFCRSPYKGVKSGGLLECGTMLGCTCSLLTVVILRFNKIMLRAWAALGRHVIAPG
jgi:hypothetical protein